MLYHRANHVSPTIVGNCLSCEDGQDVHAYLVDDRIDSWSLKLLHKFCKEFLV